MGRVERWLTGLGLLLCGLVVAATLVLVAVRIVAGPRTLNHERGPCPPPRSETVCVHDRYSGNVVDRPWMVVFGTLSVCSAAIGLTLVKHRKALTSA
ncbi:MAG: hypothetical protein ABR549_19005 [Mycobacteriales bacterium]